MVPTEKPKIQIELRPGTKKDIPTVIDLGYLFFTESNFKELTIDEDRFTEVMQNGLDSGELFLDVATVNGAVAGFLVWGLERYYTVEMLASMFLFYVHPNFRGHTSIAKRLLEASTANAAERGAVCFYAASTAGISGAVDAQMEALLTDSGFDLLGRFGRKML